MWQEYTHERHSDVRKTQRAVSKSRFSHFQSLTNNLDNCDGMVIIAGVGLRPTTATPRNQTPGATGVFVTLAVDENKVLSPFTTTMVKPATTKEKGTRFICSQQNDSDRTNRVVGRVTICQEMDGMQRILVQRKLKLPDDQLTPIVVNLLDHNDQSKYKITITPADTVDSFRKRLWRELDVSHDETIVCNGKPLKKGHTLGYYRVAENCTMHLIASMIGG